MPNGTDVQLLTEITISAGSRDPSAVSEIKTAFGKRVMLTGFSRFVLAPADAGQVNLEPGKPSLRRRGPGYARAGSSPVRRGGQDVPYLHSTI